MLCTLVETSPTITPSYKFTNVSVLDSMPVLQAHTYSNAGARR